MTDTSPVFFNPLEAGYIEDPWPHLAQMRQHDPVHDSFGQQWMLFRYDDVFKLLRDPTLSADDRNAKLEDRERQEMFDRVHQELGIEPDRNRSILNIDPPDHTRLRRLVSKAFTPRSIEALRPGVQARVDETLDEIEDEGGGDLVEKLAFPLPFDVISDMLGMPETDSHQIRDWSEALVKTLDPIVTEEEFKEALVAGMKMDAHLDSVIEWKRNNPGDDLLTRMIEAEEDGDRMTARELRDQVSLLFIAGHETTVNLIGTGLKVLYDHPEQAALWRNNPDLDANAVDELLRFVSPVQFSRRIATADLDYGGKQIEKGKFVLAGLSAANHDPEHWGETAEELDLTRDGAGSHVSFGSGAHYCLGASLAKLEGAVAMRSVLERFPSATITDHKWNGRINLRGLETLEVEV